MDFGIWFQPHAAIRWVSMVNGNREGYYVVLITGDRDYQDVLKIRKRIRALRKKHGDKLIIVTGECDKGGADILARAVCKAIGVWYCGVPAPWSRFPVGRGNPAGPIRNEFMLNLFNPDEVDAFHPNLSKSKGTKDCVERAEKKGIKVRKFK